MKYYVKRRAKRKSDSRHTRSQSDHHFKQLFNVTSDENDHRSDRMSVYLDSERARIFSSMTDESS